MWSKSFFLEQCACLNGACVCDSLQARAHPPLLPSHTSRNESPHIARTSRPVFDWVQDTAILGPWHNLTREWLQPRAAALSFEIKLVIDDRAV